MSDNSPGSCAAPTSPGEVSATETAAAIVLFDGMCLMCSAIVRFVYKRDPHARLRFAPLQSETGQRLLQRFGLAADRLDTFVLVEGTRCTTKSTAALRLVRLLSGLWPLLYAAITIPRPLRDAAYSFVAKRRYRWFGRSAACMVPTPELKRRFAANSENPDTMS